MTMFPAGTVMFKFWRATPRGVGLMLVALSLLALPGCEGDTKAKTKSAGVASIGEIATPGYVPVGTTVDATAAVTGDAGATYSWEVTAATDGGTFDPASGDVKLDSGGKATITLSYTAPDDLGTFDQTLAVSNSDGDSVQGEFTIKVTGVGAALYADTNFVYYDPLLTDFGQAASNVQVDLEMDGFAVAPFTGSSTASFANAVVGRAVLVITGFQNTNFNDTISNSTRDAIESYVARGGTLIAIPANGFTEQLLNDVFGLALTTGGAIAQSALDLDGAAADGTPFEGASSTLPDLATTWAVDSPTLPGSAIDLYEDNSDRASVFVIPHGDGQILYLGWDWFDAQPVGTMDGGWLDILRRGMEAAETAGY